MAINLKSITSDTHKPQLKPVRNLEAEIAHAARFVRQHVIASIYRATSGHPGGSLSCADILAALYGAELNLWPNTVDDPMRDRFVLSKGHAAPALYAIGAYHGFCGKRDSLALRKLGTRFQGHPHIGDLPWVETSTGSLGQGFSVALGMAMGLKLQRSTARVYTLLGDGELQEGEVWEGAMCAAHHQLDNFCAIIDYNKLQSDARNDAIMRLEPLAAKWRAFDWAVAEIDGHSIQEILSTFRRAGATRARPSVIIAHTVKGKGVPYMENIPAWHGSVKLTHEQAEDALRALGASHTEIKEYLDVDAR
ncbi:MAG TPA: transketolase [Rhizomicrobium sp.]|jgi:transketolase|nr:transketolase [Rhizomicrobium sp.]